jgi:hypothetical protein
MAQQYKLSYFNARGYAEAIRFVFAYARIPYEDIRYQHDDGSWAAAKSSMHNFIKLLLRIN